MEEACKELPEYCWELIASRLDHHRQWEPLSLVSKKLLSITNHLRTSLKVINPSIEIFSKQLQRLPNVRRIDLSKFKGPLKEAFLEIARSGVNIEELNVSYKSDPCINLLKDLGSKMKNIKVFRCSKSYLKDSDLIVLADSLSSIEELDISEQHFQYITDEGISAMSMKLKNLQKINLSGNSKISDQSIFSLSLNCESLTDIVLRYCYKVTRIGISFAMENSRCYASLILATNIFHPFELTNSLKFSKHVSMIDLNLVKISDEFLDGIIKANIPLKKFHLSGCKSFTLYGIYSLLEAYPSLESLAFNDTEILTDESVILICQFISNLITIKLNSCSKLTCTSFIAIASSCPLIKRIEISSISNGKTRLEYDPGSQKNPSITSVALKGNALKELLPICPNLRTLNVISVFEEVDIALVLNCCHEIKHLTVNYCGKLTFDREREEETCKLEWLSARSSKINDDMLEMVVKRCPELYYLNLEKCTSVTERGVREVAEHCRQLRYVNLDWCVSVNKVVVAWMVASCPSLRQIVTPGPTDHSRGEIERFLRHGCIVIPGSWEEEWY